MFFDVSATISEEKEIKKALEKAASDFYLAQEGLKFKMNGIENRISIHAGKLGEWKELQSSMEGSAIVLYGKYVSEKKAAKSYDVIYWESPGMPARSAFLNKIYGYSVGKKRYSGLIERIGGERIGRSAAVIPVQKREEFIETLEKYGVQYRILQRH